MSTDRWADESERRKAEAVRGAERWRAETARLALVPGLPDGWAEAIAALTLPEGGFRDSWARGSDSPSRAIAAAKSWADDTSQIVTIRFPEDPHELSSGILFGHDEGEVAWSETHVYVHTIDREWDVSGVTAYLRNPPEAAP